MTPLQRARTRVVLLAFGLVLAQAEAQAPGDHRVALIVGNAAYPAQHALANPVNDARAMTAAMKRLGFEVIELRDGTREEMAAAIQRTRTLLAGKRGVGMLYYAGHGVQHDWSNYMVPVDARLRAVEDIPAQTVGLAEVLEAFRAAGNRLNVVVLDACRDNPFDNELATKGLAPIDAPPGTFLAFATTPGNVAADGGAPSANGLYTHYLLEELARPAARLEDVFKRARLQVRERSGGRQVPSESTNLDEEFSFDQGFSRAEPRTDAARLARFQAEKSEWDRIRSSQSSRDFYEFLQRYPNGFMSEIAQFRYDQVHKPLLVAQAARDSVVALASGRNRFAVGDEFTHVVTDRLTLLVRRERYAVTAATDERVEINGGAMVYNQMGGVLRDDSGDKDPPVLLVPADIALGKRWRSLFENRYADFRMRTIVDFRTVAQEEVELGGLRVKAFKVEFNGFVNTVSVQGQLWIEPGTMRMVRMDRMVRVGGAILDSSSTVVIDYRPAPR